MGARNATEDRAELVLALHALADEELRAAIRELNHRRRFQLARGGERGVDRVVADAVDRRKGEPCSLCIIEQLFHFVSEKHARTESFGFRHGSGFYQTNP